MMTRRSLMAAAGATLAAAQGKKPNFLFLIADDHAGYVLGADGNRRAHTPNLDRLASGGMRFASHYCNAPVCTPSRQSFFTGQMPSSAGVTVLQTALSEDKPTLAKQLRGAGYNTAVFGKMHFNRPGRPGLHGFDECVTERELQQAWSADVKPEPPPEGARTKPQWRPFRDPASVWLNAEKLPYPRRDQEMKGTYLARRAAKFIEERKGDPFALWVSFHEPHSPFDFPVEYTSRFDHRSFEPPRVGPEDAWQIPIIFRDLTPEQKQGIIAAYYTSVAFLDRNIGTVLDQLRRSGLENDTLVVYMPDHGYSLGQHGRFEKHCPYDPALRVPLIIRYPGRVRKGVVRDFTESIDIAPTILDVLGVDGLPLMHGQSLRPYLEGRKPAQPRDHIFSQYLENEEVFVRNDRYKYAFCSGKRKRTDGYLIDNPTPGRYMRLFDLKKDPGEFHDVAKENPEVVANMQRLILDRYRATHPEASSLPKGLDAAESIEWFVRPRDAKA